MYKNILIAILVIACASSSAFADTIANRLGFTGRAGVAVPVNDDFINGTSETKAGFAAGGGLIYGFGDYLAAELDVSYLPKLDVKTGGVKSYEARLTDIGLGLQYRITPGRQLVPFVGAGVDFINGRLKHVSGNSYDLDWTYGGHINAGLDWFLTKGVALTADFRAVRAMSGDILSGSSKVSEYDPFWVQGTFGARFILPEKF
jgi:outer membrane protein